MQLPSEEVVKLKKVWRADGLDFKADLGLMKDAIVVRLVKEMFCSKEAHYQISNYSKFYFPDEYYHLKFDNYIAACELAENYILDWMRSILINSNPNKTITLPSN